MIEPPFGALLMPAIGATPLLEPGFIAASDAAIALPAVALRTKKEHGVALLAQTNALPENDIARNRHACWQAGLDNKRATVAF